MCYTRTGLNRAATSPLNIYSTKAGQMAFEFQSFFWSAGVQKATWKPVSDFCELLSFLLGLYDTTNTAVLKYCNLCPGFLAVHIRKELMSPWRCFFHSGTASTTAVTSWLQTGRHTLMRTASSVLRSSVDPFMKPWGQIQAAPSTVYDDVILQVFCPCCSNETIGSQYFMRVNVQ